MDFIRRTFFLSVNGVVDAFNERVITPDDVFRHLLIMGILFPVGTFIAPVRLQPADMPTPGSGLTLLLTWIGHAAIVTLGWRYCYKRNDQPDYFVRRVICLSLPIIVQINLFGFCVFGLLSLTLLPVFAETLVLNRAAIAWVVFVVVGLGEIAYFLYLGTALARIRTNGPEPVQEAASRGE